MLTVTARQMSPAPDPVPGFRLRLRAATQADHDRVEAAFDRLDLTSPDGLARFLTAQAEAMGTVHAALGPDGLWPHRIETLRSLLTADLADLGRPPVPPARAATVLPHPVGAIYVLAGSRLGAAVLVVRQRKARDLGVQAARRYLSSTLPPGAWRQVCADLDAIDDPEEAQRIVEAARWTFRVFGRAAMKVLDCTDV